MRSKLLRQIETEHAAIKPQRSLPIGNLQVDMADADPSDHGVSEAIYLRAPDENGVELYWDRPQKEWPRTNEGELAMFSRRFDLNDLLKEAEVMKESPQVDQGPQDL